MLNVHQGAGLAAAAPSPVLQANGDALALQERDVSSGAVATTPEVEVRGVEARANSRMTLQWSPEGRVMFLTGLVSLNGIYRARCAMSNGIEGVVLIHAQAQLPTGILDALYATGTAGPAKVMTENFRQYLISQGQAGLRALNLFYLANRGGVYGAGTGDVAYVYPVPRPKLDLTDCLATRTASGLLQTTSPALVIFRLFSQHLLRGQEELSK